VVTLEDLRRARAAMAPALRETPVVTSRMLDRLTGTRLALKAENLQRTGSFKPRGALNRLLALTEEERAAGVVAASAGNHGQAVDWAAARLGLRCTVIMPTNAAMAKVEATREYGATVELAGETVDDSLGLAAARRDARGETLIHPFDDARVIAGQGTVGLELLEQVEDLDTVVVPIGGGGLAAGIAVALSELRPSVRLIGVQAAACAPFAGRDPAGHTIADGIAVKRPGELTSAILRSRLADIRTVTDEEIAGAVVMLLERCKLLVEGAGAAAVAALLAPDLRPPGTTCAILSGGNIDGSMLLAVVRAGLTHAGRYLRLDTTVADRPGQLAGLLDLIGRLGGNIMSVDHRREGRPGLSVLETEVELTILARDHRHRQDILDELEVAGYRVRRDGC
jgi:threonine dehydratase